MIPNRLKKIIRCLKCGGESLEYNEQESSIACTTCSSIYPAVNGIPSMLEGGASSQEWNAHDPESETLQKLGNSYYKRSKGELPEKESSKSFANLMKRNNLYSPGDTILDIGSATGHFLVSFRRILGPEVRYTGIDTTYNFLQWGAEIFGQDESCNFVHCDALEMPFNDRSFDTVVVNLFQFFPDIEKALRESMRVAKKMVLWRTPIGQTNYIVKVIHENSFEKLKIMIPERTDFNYTLYMMYSKEYIEGLVKHLGGRLAFIEQDTDFEEFDNTALEGFESITATKVISGMQINGNLILDWQYVAIDCSDL